MQEVKTASLSKYISLTSDHSIARAFWIVTFAIVTAIGAQVEIPLRPVPLTLQTFFVILSGAFLREKKWFSEHESLPSAWNCRVAGIRGRWLWSTFDHRPDGRISDRVSNSSLRHWISHLSQAQQVVRHPCNGGRTFYHLCARYNSAQLRLFPQLE